MATFLVLIKDATANPRGDRSAWVTVTANDLDAAKVIADRFQRIYYTQGATAKLMNADGRPLSTKENGVWSGNTPPIDDRQWVVEYNGRVWAYGREPGSMAKAREDARECGWGAKAKLMTQKEIDSLK